jgi:alpha,alpha-trehalase
LVVARGHRKLGIALLLAWVAAPGICLEQAPTAAASPATAGPAPILDYIETGWDILTRSISDCATIVDPKVVTKSVLYVPADFAVTPEISGLEQKCGVEIRALPKVIRGPGEVDTNSFHPHGLLYLPNRYVVPGGRFNEMYGWDSYFILLGLLRDGRVELARGMVENFLFEIEHYGSILNANRTYYLSRSQPPFLTSMILAVYEAEKKNGNADREWLERAYKFAARDHETWMAPESLAGNTGLSRYFDFGEGPAPESLKDEVDHYEKVTEYFVNHSEQSAGRIEERLPGENKDLGPGEVFSLRLCDMPQSMQSPMCNVLQELSLSRDFYKGDRAMRESGFDITFRFGPFGADTHHYAPVCLNSLLYKEELDLAGMSDTLGRKSDAESWHKRAAERKAAMNKYFWDEVKGEFFDYDFVRKQRSSYSYLTTYYPLWVGLATAKQAKAVVANLKVFERVGGAMMSPYETGAQWDEPYAWAPVQMILVGGLRRYGFGEDAERIAYEFATMVAENYAKQGYIVEKYNAVTRTTDASVSVGYQINVVGFGWTNAAYLEFFQGLPETKQNELKRIH